MDNFVDRLIKSGITDENKIIGCKYNEIKSLEDSLNIRLPEIYKQFLLLMGKSNECGFFTGEKAYFSHLYNIKLEANKLLKEEKSILCPLKPEQFVFYMHEGYQFYFFDTKDGDNPPVFYYDSINTYNYLQEKEDYMLFNKPNGSKVFNSFSKFLNYEYFMTLKAYFNIPINSNMKETWM